MENSHKTIRAANNYRLANMAENNIEKTALGRRLAGQKKLLRFPELVHTTSGVLATGFPLNPRRLLSKSVLRVKNNNSKNKDQSDSSPSKIFATTANEYLSRAKSVLSINNSPTKPKSENKRTSEGVYNFSTPNPSSNADQQERRKSETNFCKVNHPDFCRMGAKVQWEGSIQICCTYYRN